MSRQKGAAELDARRTVINMPAVVPPATSLSDLEELRLSPLPPAPSPAAPSRQAPEPAKPARKDAPGKKPRKGNASITVEQASPEEVDSILEAVDVGFESIQINVEPDPPKAAPKPSAPAAAPAVPVEKPKADRKSEPGPPVTEAMPTLPRGAPVPVPETEAMPTLPRAAPVIDEATRRAQHEADMTAVRALFSEMAVPHARPLRDFMIEVTWGDPTREWLDVAIPATAALRRAADTLEMPVFVAGLDGFSAALELTAGEATIGRDAKELLIGAYAKLVEALPAAFELTGERGRREPIIVRSLLLQVPNVQKVAIDKIYSAGLTSLEMLYAASPRDLAATTGLALDVATGICERLQRYRKEIAEWNPAKDRAAERAELTTATAELARAHEEHERLSKAWSSDAAAGRARARKERNDAVLRINVLLARMGEVDRQKALEKVPFAQKIRDLTQYLDEAKRKAARP